MSQRITPLWMQDPSGDVRYDPASAPIDGQGAPLVMHSLFNDLAELARLLAGELQRGAWLNAYLLAAGMNQIVEDYTHPDPFLLGQVADYLEELRQPFGRWGARAASALGTALASLWAYSGPARRAARWQAGLADLVQQLAELATLPPADRPQPGADRHAGEALVAAAEHLAPSLRRGLPHLPSCFQAFDQRPADLERTAAEFAACWPDRRRPLAVVGVRTSGNYLAPLYVAYLKRAGYAEVCALTLRPGRGLWAAERALLRSVVGHDGLVLLTDDPPVTGHSLVKAAQALERCGVPGRAIVLLLQLCGPRSSLPPALAHYASVLLPWDAWAIHEQLAVPAITAALAELLGPSVRVAGVERVPLPAPRSQRGHLQARYRVRLAAGERVLERQILVKGTGLGYLGDSCLAAVHALANHLPQVYGLRDGLLYRAWLPEERSLASLPPSEASAADSGIVSYVVDRHSALPVAEDLALRMRGEWPAWEVASNVASRAFASARPLARALAVDPIVQLALHVEHPSAVDGDMALSNWFRGEPGRPPIKVDWGEGALRSGAGLTCYDPVFDLASLAASVDLDLPNHAGAGALAQHLRALYARAAGQPVAPERWLLYQWAWLLREERERGDGQRARRASARAMQRYWSDVYFHDLTVPAAGELCALDVDGVLETSALGFPIMTPSAALALRALHRHGFRPVLATGRSLGEVRERCAAYRLAGGVAEYGTVCYNQRTGHTVDLLSDCQRRDLDYLRAVLHDAGGVHLDPDYQHSVRAYRLDAQGRRQGLDATTIRAVLAGVSERLRPISGEGQTDFVPARVDKGTGLCALAASLTPGGLAAQRTTPMRLAIGDTVSDVPMFRLAAMAFAPGHADRKLLRGSATILRQPYQRGLLQAVGKLLGHRPGRCPVCQAPHLSPDVSLLLSTLAAQETDPLGMVWTMLSLAARARRLSRRIDNRYQDERPN